MEYEGGDYRSMVDMVAVLLELGTGAVIVAEVAARAYALRSGGICYWAPGE